MHNAPPAAFPVGRFVWGRVVLLVMALLGALGLLEWQSRGHVAGMLALWAWIFWGLCVAGAAFWAPRQALSQGRLCWRGDAWFWQAEDGHAEREEQSLALSVGLDWGSGLLLFARQVNVQGQTSGSWFCVWLNKDASPSAWHGLRCAVYSPVKARRGGEPLGAERV